MEKKDVERIFKEHNLGKVGSFVNIEIGFTNKVYSINDNFILKVCEDESNEQNFEKEVFSIIFLRIKFLFLKLRFLTNPKLFMANFL